MWVWHRLPKKHGFFTKNGTLLITYPFPFITLGLYVTIGTQLNGETVEVNFGSKPFTFDIVQYQHEIRDSEPHSALTVPYSTLAVIFDERLPNRKDQYEELDYQDKYLAFDSQMGVLSSMQRLITDFPDDSSSFKSKVERLIRQMESEGVSVPSNIEMNDLREALRRYTHNKKLLLMYSLMDTPANLNMLDALFDTFSSQIMKCINVLSHNYPPNHHLVNYTYGILREHGLNLPEDTNSHKRSYCRSLLLKLDLHLLQRKANRREALRKLPSFDPSFYNYNVVDNLTEDIDNNESYQQKMQAYPFTPRQNAMMEHIVNCISNSDLSDDDPTVTTAIAQCYFEFRRSMPLIVNVRTERAKLMQFLTQMAQTEHVLRDI
jgi:hypothetical protein